MYKNISVCSEDFVAQLTAKTPAISKEDRAIIHGKRWISKAEIGRDIQTHSPTQNDIGLLFMTIYILAI